MQLELWGANTAPFLDIPQRPIGYVVMGVYGFIFLALIYWRRSDLSMLSSRRWTLVTGLAALAIIVSLLFPLTISSESQLPPLSTARNPETTLVPFGFLPIILAGAILNPLAALIVGLAGGLTTALWQTHQLSEPFHYAFAAALMAILMRQQYSGLLFRLLRYPLISSLLGVLLIVPLTVISTIAYAEPAASNLSALDLALSTAGAYLPLFLIQGTLGGLLVILIRSGLPQELQQPILGPSPVNRSLNTRLFATFMVFAVILSLVLIIIGFNLAVKIATGLAKQQLVHDANAVSVQIPDFLARHQQLLVQTAEQHELINGDLDAKEISISQLFHRGDYFRSILLVDGTEHVIAYVPNDEFSGNLTKLEEDAIETLLRTKAPYISPGQPVVANEFVLSFIVSVPAAENNPGQLLIGRVPGTALTDLVAGLQGTLGNGTGFIVDDTGQVIGHPDPSFLMQDWAPPDDDRPLITFDQAVSGIAFLGVQGSTNTRQLTYYQIGPEHSWTVVLTLPYEEILAQAMQISSQLALILFAALIFFGIYLLLLGQSITGPLSDLAVASQQIAAGKLNTTINPQGDDEIGRLSHAFGQMQIALKTRLDELSLLLEVSQDVSRSIDVNEGIPSIMKGAVRGTGAAGVRVVVLNPSGRQPLGFGEGPAEELMARYDRQIMGLVRNRQILTLSTPDEVSNLLKRRRESDQLPKSIIALPLMTHNRFQGVFWLTHRQPHHFKQSELNFLRTLAGQTSVLVENARLYATAEGGRRRLAAVLASTSDAVIVTDQTDHILLINPAMERSFNINAGEVIGRRVQNTIQSKSLVEALTSESVRSHNLEIPTEEGKTLYASVATIFNKEQQAIGRVAVLHDITYLKEIDEMKSEFVATVSHDLRSPLTYITGYASTLAMVGELDPKQQEYVDKILGGINRMTNLIENLLDIGRLEAGVDLVRSRFRVEEILTSVAEEYDQQARAEQIKLVVQGAKNLPQVEGEVPLIRQAVANLTSNAIKYASGSEKIILSATIEDGNVVICVKDFGPGISPKDQLRLFEKFYQVEQNGRNQKKGTGLGLALVKSIAERHGGRAWVESQPGKGSAFYISLPLSPSSS